jgi:hypothetical protein
MMKTAKILLQVSGEPTLGTAVSSTVNISVKRVNAIELVSNLHDGKVLTKLSEMAVEEASKNLTSDFIVHTVSPHGVTHRAVNAMKRAAPKV